METIESTKIVETNPIACLGRACRYFASDEPCGNTVEANTSTEVRTQEGPIAIKLRRVFCTTQTGNQRLAQASITSQSPLPQETVGAIQQELRAPTLFIRLVLDSQ